MLWRCLSVLVGFNFVTNERKIAIIFCQKRKNKVIIEEIFEETV
jgi:hypothetical protein